MNWKTKSLLIQIFWFTAILSLCLWLSSCRTQRGAERKIHKLTEKFPELLKKTDTTFFDTVQIIGITYKDSISLQYDTNWTDSLVIKYNVPRNEAKKILNEASKFKDTLTIDTTIHLNTDSATANIKVVAKVYQKDGRLMAELVIPPSSFIIERKFSYERIVIKELTFWEKNRSWIIPVLVLIVGSGIAKKIGIL